ncbi:GNAT family N-acetyltransferase [Congregibacter sp.]|uniref:GNAT family N-acetyltransferase n=1 Tax=Congregibacter sp. TaxID=2744308 RepID=UPI0039E5DE02
MSTFKNKLGQAVGAPVANWRGCAHPRGAVIEGRLCRLEPVDADRHARDLFAAFSEDHRAGNWTYLPYGPFAGEDELHEWIKGTCLGDDPCFFSIIDLANGQAVGVASYLRIEPAIGVIEVGHIHFSPLIQGRSISTEVMYLMMRQVFEVLGYRRYEWKCDSLNGPSCAAATRLGFLFEGIFRKATMYKQRNRDTAWYSILDHEWPAARTAFETWLDSANFDDAGKQRQRLSDLMQPLLSVQR